MNTDLKIDESQQNRQTKTLKRIFAARRGIQTGMSSEEKELLNYIADARKEWAEASTNFEHAFEEKLIDYYTYKMKACEARYTYFIKIAKEKGLRTAE